MVPQSKTVTWMALGALLLAVLLTLAATVRGSLDAQEVPLNPEGRAYEINAGPQGMLWISDNGAEEIWALDPSSGAYTVYHGVGRASDARQAGDGSVWWIDQEDNRLGKLLPDSSQTEMWRIPGAATLFGTAVDVDGNVWLTQFFDPQVYRFTPASEELCTYTLGPSGGSRYILADPSYIWLTDWINTRIHRLDPGSAQLTSWVLPDIPGGISPEGLVSDDEATLWWADISRRHLARLEPESSRLTTYSLPPGSTPHMVAFSGPRLWYTEGRWGTLGQLDPTVAAGTSLVLTSEDRVLIPTCANLTPVWTGTLTTSTGILARCNVTYTASVDTGGWWIYQLPADAYPWGIAVHEGQVWVVDTGRQALIHVQDSRSIVACKLADADGDVATTDDQTPVANWTMQLIADGVPVEPVQLTGPTGCTTWEDLEPGVSYAVEEKLLPDWAPLGPVSHTFGILIPGESYFHTFINRQADQRVYVPLILR